MPICAKCGVSHDPCVGHVPSDQTVKPCDKKQGGIWVHVMDDAGKIISAVPVSQGGSNKDTDPTGVAMYDPLADGSYTVALGTLPQQITDDYDPPNKTSTKAKVSKGGITYVDFTLTRKAALKVKVVSKDSSKLFNGATVDVSGPQPVSGKKTAASGIADCRKVTAGKYTIKVKLTSEDEKDWATTLDFEKKGHEVTLSPGDDKEVVIEVEKKNEVKPKLELEYCLVLWDNKLYDKVSKGAKIMAAPTYVEVSLEQSNTDHKFAKGAKIECTPANADIYLDDELSKKVSGGKLTNEQISADKPLKLYLKGVTQGKFKIKVTLEDPADRFVKLKDNPTPDQDMGVVQLELKVHSQDIDKLKASAMNVNPDVNPESAYHDALRDKVMPDQKLMKPEEKTGESSSTDGSKPGRLLHMQAGGHFGRAMVILAKLNAAHIPDAADAYEIVVNVGRGYAATSEKLKVTDLMGGPKDDPISGNVSFWDNEFDGAEINPLKFTVADLKAAEKKFWVEGKAETDRTCDVRIDAGLDRAAGGLAKTVKRNGDWARFTVLTIKEIKVEYKPKAGKPNQWDQASNRFYINLKKDPSGRNIDIQVELNKPLKNIVVHFMLAPAEHNKKTANWGVDMPATWQWGDIVKDVKHKDKAQRPDFLHLAEKTDKDGKAKKTLVLSRFGGDNFWPACYFEQDAHLAKYVDGHADLGKRIPDRAAAAVQVWRRFWYQLINVENVANPGVAGAIGQYDRIKAEMEAADPKAVSSADATKWNAIYPRYMVQVNGGNANALVISDKNKKKFFSGIKSESDKPVKVPILIGDAQWDTGPATDAFTSNFREANRPFNIGASRLVLKPPLQGGKLLISGTVEYRYKDPADPTNTAWIQPAPIKITDDMVDVDPARATLKNVRVALPAAVTAKFGTDPTTEVRIENFSVKGAKGPYLGESFEKKVLAVYEPTEPVDFQNTIAHEVGHGFGQTVRAGQQPNGIPDHPNQYISYDSDGMSTGSHCNKDVNLCVMYQSGPQPGSHNRYCDTCHPYMLVHDLSKYE